MKKLITTTVLCAVLFSAHTPNRLFFYYICPKYHLLIMKILIFLLFLFLLISGTINAQSSFIQWQKSLGGTGGDIALSISQTPDGGFIIAGLSQSNDGDVIGNHGAADYWIVKLNSFGDTLWTNSLGGSGVDNTESIIITTDSGFAICGSSTSNDGDVTGNHGSFDYWIVKLDNMGDTLWTKSLGGSGADFAYSISQTADGGFIVAGKSNSNDGDVIGNHGDYDYWIVKLDSMGDTLWTKSFGGSGSDFANFVIQTNDGGFIIAGSSNSDTIEGNATGNHGGYDYWIVKLNSIGNLVWHKSLGGTNLDHALSIIQTIDGGFIVAGGSRSNDGDVTGNNGFEDFWIVKLDSIGVIDWQKSLGGLDYEFAFSIYQTMDSGYIVAGFSNSNDGNVTDNHGGYDYWIVKLNGFGNIDWQQSLGGTGSDEAHSIIQTNDGSFIIAGYSDSNDGDITGNHGSSDYWIIKLSCFLIDIGSDTVISCGDSIILNLNISGGVNFLWSPSTGLSDTTIINPFASPNKTTTYTVTATDGYCTLSDSVTVYVINPDTTQICLITVDSTSTKNVIVWQKPISTMTDSFKIYRDIIGTYTHIGSVAYEDLSFFTDTTNGINPNTTSYRYKISTLDTCGNESDTSAFHETIHLIVIDGGNKVDLIWDNYEGFAFPFFYRIMRDSTGTGNFEKIDSVTDANTQYTDWSPPQTGNAAYLIEVIHSTGCTATLMKQAGFTGQAAKSKDYNTTRSNFQNKVIQSVEQKELTTNNIIKVFPNPYTGTTQIIYTLFEKNSVNIEIFNLIGKKIKTLVNETLEPNKYQYSFSAKELGLAQGMYFLKAAIGSNVYTKKILEY